MDFNAIDWDIGNIFQKIEKYRLLGDRECQENVGCPLWMIFLKTEIIH